MRHQYVRHRRLDKAEQVTTFEREGRRYVIWRWTNHEDDLDQVALTVSGGSHAPVVEPTGYRQGSGGPITLPLPVLLRKEMPLDRIGKRLGVAIEPQTGREEFDRSVFIETDAPEGSVRPLFSNEATTRATVDA